MCEKENSSKAKDVIEAATGLVKAIPIYEDLAQPAVKELGIALATVAKTINVALAPVSTVVWGYETIKDFVDINVAQKLTNIPPENIISPSPVVAGPALDALRYTGHIDTLRDMYANLLANALDKKTAGAAHPSFVELIKQLSPEEAKLLLFISERNCYPKVCNSVTLDRVRGKYSMIRSKATMSSSVKSRFIGVCTEFKENLDVGSALDNFRRLQILDMESNTSQSIHKDQLGLLLDDDRGLNIELEIEITHSLFFTDFGKKFIETCVRNKV